MPQITVFPTIDRLPPLLVAIALGVLGAITNLFLINMFANTQLVFGGTFVMLAAILMRPTHALLCALIAYSTLAFVWGHGWGYLWFPLEALFVNWMVRQRVHALIADLLFWLLIGMPLVYLVLISTNELSQPMLATILIKQALNGYLYTLLAAFLAMLPGCRRLLADTPQVLPSLKVYLTQAFGMLATVTLLAYGLASERVYTATVQNQLQEELENHTTQISNYARLNRVQETQLLDSLAKWWLTDSDPEVLPNQVQLDQQFNAINNYIALLVANPDGSLVRYSQRQDFTHRLTINHPAPKIHQPSLALARQHHQVVLSGPFTSFDYGYEPILYITQPIYGSDDFSILGYIQAILPLHHHMDNIEAILHGTNFEFIALNPEQTATIASRSLNLPLRAKFNYEVLEENRLPLPLPALRADFGDRKQVYFYHHADLADGAEVFVLSNANEVLTDLQQHYLKWALFIGIASIASVLLGQLLASLFTRPLGALLRFSNNESLPIPASQSNTDNFHYKEQHQLFASMVRKTNALATYQNSLEQQVSTRTHELQVLNDRLSRVLQASSDGILEVNDKKRINFANQTVTSWLGLTEDQMVGQPIDSLLLPVTGAMTLEQCVHEARTTLSMAEGEGQIRHDDNLLELEFNSAPTSLEDGSIGAVVMLRNITNRKEIQRNLEQARRSAELAAQAKSDFVANVSHEIRTPLNAIGGLVQLFGQNNLSDEQKQYLKRMAHGADLLQAIVNDILDFSKIEAGHLELNEQAFDIEALLDNLKLLMLPKAEEKQLQLNVELANDVPIGLIGDSLRISQILMNLVSNAIKFTSQGHVTLTVTQLPERSDSQAYLRLSVSDSGIGIPNEKISQLFRPFTQADNATTRQYGGTGLGLAICQRLVELMDSEIHVSSIPERGSKFWFDIQLPIAAPTATLQQAPSNSSKQPSLIFFGQHVLVVEDNSVNLQITQLMLSRLGLKTTGINSATKALKLLQQQNFDLVLMDLQMPEVDGIEATKLIRLQAQFDRLPVVALTAHVSVSDKQRCLDAGMQDHIGKPVVMNELMRVLSRHLSYQIESHPLSGNTNEIATETADKQFLQQQFYERYSKLDVHLRTLVEIDAWQDARELALRALKASEKIQQQELRQQLEKIEKSIAQQTWPQQQINELADLLAEAKALLSATSSA